jgi:O-antigen/teichoic acid export membrane protein
MNRAKTWFFEVTHILGSRVPARSFLRGVVVLAGGGALAQILPVVMTPVLTRLYSPSDMGLLALYTSFIGFATAGVALGYSMAIISANSDYDAADLVVISGIVAVPISIIGGVTLFLLTSKNWLGFGQLPFFASGAMVLSLILTGMYVTLRLWLVRFDQYSAISVATITQSVARVCLQIVFGLGGLGGVGLIGGEVVGRGVGLRQMWRESNVRIRRLSGTSDRNRIWATAITYRKFPLLSAPSSLLNSLAIALPIPLISSGFDIDAAGQFSVASRILLLPLALIGASIGDVFHSRIFRLSVGSPALALPLLLRTFGTLLAIGSVPMAIVAVFGDTLWPAILGEEWATSGRIAAVITPWALMQFVVSPVSRVVAVYRGQEFKLVVDILSLSAIIGVMRVAKVVGWSLVQTSAVLGITQAIIYGLYFLLLIQVVRKNVDINVESESSEGAGV